MADAQRKLPTGDVSPTVADLTDGEFAYIAETAERCAGLLISQNKKDLVQTRLLARMRTIGVESFNAYVNLIGRPEGIGERDRMIASLTTNVTTFFREPHHFEQLKSDVFPQLVRRARSGGRVRIWSAGCSSGQEAYTLAMTLMSIDAKVADCDVRILASDIDDDTLNEGRLGRYSVDEMASVPEIDRDRFFEPSSCGRYFTPTPEIRSLVVFRNLNLVGPWPMQHPFDVIFCRNVVIYFSRERQMQLWEKFCDALCSDGWLFLGHSERLSGPAQCQFKPAGVTAFRKARPLCGTGTAQQRGGL